MVTGLSKLLSCTSVTSLTLPSLEIGTPFRVLCELFSSRCCITSGAKECLYISHGIPQKVFRIYVIVGKFQSILDISLVSAIEYSVAILKPSALAARLKWISRTCPIFIRGRVPEGVSTISRGRPFGRKMAYPQPGNTRNDTLLP